MKIAIILTVFFLTNINLFCQKEAYNWNFGTNSALTFNTSNLEPVFVENSKLVTWEGCTTISDGEGNLLFYSSGNTIWNKNNSIMDNGADLFGHSSSTQSCIAFKKPGSETQYYIFTVDAIESNSKGFNYSIVDMSYNNGLGKVTEKNIIIHPKPIERLMIIPHANKIDFWVIVHLWQNNEFLAYLVTSSGVSNIPVISKGKYFSPKPTGAVIKASIDGKKIASAHSYAKVIELFDFDDYTGKMTLTHNLLHSYFEWPYGVEFSPDKTKLYASLFSPCRLIQLDLTKTTEQEIMNSLVILGQNNQAVFYYGSLQLAPNGKIYVAQDGTYSLGVINYPNLLNLNCNYEAQGFNLLNGAKSGLGLPTFVQSFLNPEQTCQPKGDELIENGNFDIFKYNFESDLNFVDEGKYSDFNITGSILISDKNPLNLDDPCNLYNNNNNMLHINTNSGVNDVIKLKVDVVKDEVYVFSFKFSPLIDKVFKSISIIIDGDTINKQFIYTNGLCNQKQYSFQWITKSDKKVELIFRVTSDKPEVFSIDDISFKTCSCPKLEPIFYVEDICKGASVNLNGRDNPEFSYSWSPPEFLDNPETSNPKATPADTTMFYLKSLNLKTGCVYYDSIRINVNPTQKINISGSEYICFGDSIALFIDSTFKDVIWEHGIKGNKIFVNKAGEYSVSCRDKNGCLYKGSKEIFYTKELSFNILGPKVVCLEEEFELEIDKEFNEYLWSEGQTGKKAKFKGPGLYKVKVKNGFNCEKEDSIIINSLPTGTIEILSPDRICNGEVINLKIEGQFKKVSWSSGESTESININAAGVYEVEVIDMNGCLLKGSKEVLSNSAITAEILPLNLGNICLNDKMNYSKIITNSNDFPIIISKVSLSKPNSKIDVTYQDTLPAQIAPHTDFSIAIGLNPQLNIGPISDTLIIEFSEPCNDIYKLPITGYVNDINSYVWLSDTLVHVGNYFCLPIFARIECDGLVETVLNYDIDIILKKNILFPDKVLTGIMSVLDLQNGYIKVNITDSVKIKNGTNIINQICGLVLLSDSLANSVIINKFNWVGNKFNVNIKNGTLNLNYCQINLNQFNLIKSTSIKSIPNISDGGFNFKITTSETGTFEIQITDINGYKIRSLFWIRENNQTSEVIEFPINLSDLNQGVYFVKLISPWSISTDKIIIVK